MARTEQRGAEVRSAVQNGLSEFTFDQIIGGNRELLAQIALAKKFAGEQAPIGLYGETGTGKDLVARAIHAHSERRGSPLVAVNCSNLPLGICENEIFGHDAGAFTGAQRPHQGLAEQADNGILFLDEVDSLPFEVQSKLLRLLEQGETRRLGGGAVRYINVRIICATNKDLLTLVREKRFRSDLYYRLNVLSLRLPPLRERRDDIPLLAEHYLNRRISEKCDLSNGNGARPWTSLASDVLQKLCGYHWPGNVRQLKNVIDRAFVTCTAGRIAVEDLELDSDVDLPPLCRDYKAAKEQFERDYFGNLLAQFGHDTSLALRASGLSRSVFYAKLRKLASMPENLTRGKS